MCVKEAMFNYNSASRVHTSSSSPSRDSQEAPNEDILRRFAWSPNLVDSSGRRSRNQTMCGILRSNDVQCVDTLEDECTTVWKPRGGSIALDRVFLQCSDEEHLGPRAALMVTFPFRKFLGRFVSLTKTKRERDEVEITALARRTPNFDYNHSPSSTTAVTTSSVQWPSLGMTSATEAGAYPRIIIILVVSMSDDVTCYRFSHCVPPRSTV